MKDDVRKSKKSTFKSFSELSLLEMLLPKPSDVAKRFEKNVKVESIDGIVGHLDRVPLAKIHVDESYQYRPEREPGRIARLEKWLELKGGFDPAEAGPIHVNVRSDGNIFVMDGGGRCWMAQRAGLKEIDAVKYKGLSHDQEKAFFLRKNKQKRSITIPHLFEVAAMAGHEPERSILDLVHEAGYGVERKRGDKRQAIFGPSSLYHVWHLDGTGDILRATLFDLRNTHGDIAGVDGRILVTVAMVRFTAGSRLDQARLRKILKSNPQDNEVPISLQELYHQARQDAMVYIRSRAIQSRDIIPALTTLLLRRYNYRLRKAAEINPRNIWKAQKALEAAAVQEKKPSHSFYKDTFSWTYVEGGKD